MLIKNLLGGYFLRFDLQKEDYKKCRKVVISVDEKYFVGIGNWFNYQWLCFVETCVVLD